MNTLDDSNRTGDRPPAALILFWLSLALAAVWGAVAVGVGLRFVVGRALGVLSGAVFIATGVLLASSLRGAVDDTVAWLRRRNDGPFARRPRIVWRLYGVFFVFLGVTVLRVALFP